LGPFFTPLKPLGANVAIERTRGFKMNEQIKLLETALALHGNLPPPAEAFDYSALQVTPDFEVAVPVEVGNRLITTINLTIDTCRWPFGDPVEPGFHYCGELPLIGRPYCDKHNSKSYCTPRSKKAIASIAL
jgi:hypothetical protein